MARHKTHRSEAIYLAGQIDKLTWLTFKYGDTDIARSMPPDLVPSLLGDISLVRLWLDEIADKACSIVTEAA